MAKRLITLMVAVLVLGFVAGGCGGDDESGDSGDTAAQTVTDTVTDDEVVTDDEIVTDTETVTEESTGTVTSDDNGGAVVPKNLEQAVEQCMKNVNAAPGLSQSTKSDLEALCDKAASGDPQQMREAAAEVCRKVIDDTVPSGTPGRAQALKACAKNTQ